MKIVLSRKGFDSSAGGVPSPLIDGRPMSLPIPTRMPTLTRYGDLGRRTAELVADLTRGRIGQDRPCHLDPDIDATSLPRGVGWRGALGQVSSAQSHLANNGVGRGDLFLFWGLFRTATRANDGRWCFSGALEHRVFGWLQVAEVIRVGVDPRPALVRYAWLDRHPHLLPGWPSDNTVYVASDELVLSGRSSGLPGYGLLPRGTRLTAEGGRMPSLWRLPSWLNPINGGSGLTYHPIERWSPDNTLRSAARGQEFIADASGREDAMSWVQRVIFETVEG